MRLIAVSGIISLEMANKDLIHNAVKNALVKDGWTITDDPLAISYGRVRLQVDLAAERTMAAEKNGRKIAIEIKSFTDPSLINDLKTAVGQYDIYSVYLELLEPERKLYVAISQKTYEKMLLLEGLEVYLNKRLIPFIVVNIEIEEIVKWIN